MPTLLPSRAREGAKGQRSPLLSLVLSVALLSSPLSAQITAQNLPTGSGPMLIAVNETTNRAYVVNRGGTSVTVIDGKTQAVIATVPTGPGPEGIAVNPRTNRIYVANSTGNSVTVIDGTTNTVAATVPAGAYCQALAVNPVTNKIYVANNSGHSVTVIDGETHQTATVRVGQGPRAIAVNATTNKIYTANYGSRDATEIDGATNKSTTIPAAKHPWTLAVDSRANKTWIVNEDSSSVTLYSGATGTTKDLVLGEVPFAVAVNPELNHAYVLTYATNTLVVIDGAAGTILKTLQLTTHPSAVAVNPKTGHIFVANQNNASVTIFDNKSYAPVTTLNTGTVPYSMAVDTTLDQIYVANISSSNTTLIRDSAAAVPPPSALPHQPKFRVLTLAERGAGDHQTFVDAAKLYLERLAKENDFAIDHVTGTERMTDASLAKYQLILQLNYPPYHWAPVAKKAFENYITEGKGGWVGFHHASLLGEFDGYPMDLWFSEFIGGIRFKSYLPDFAAATVKIEDPASPLAKGLPPSFTIDKEEWYTWSKSPRPNVKVLATVDENTYAPNTPIKMGGDHPVVWSNPHYKARNLYIFMGHHGGLFDNPNFMQLFRNAVFWGAGQ